MAMEYFCFYHSYGDKTKNLSDQELGRLVRALNNYSRTGERQQLAGRESIAFDFMADDIDRAKAAYEKKCNTNKKNVEQRYTESTNEYDRIQTNANGAKDKDKRKDKDKVKGNTGDIGASPQRTCAFVQPTPSDVREYCLQKGYAIDPEAFVDYYAKQGWKLSNGLPVRDWQACVRTWARRDQERGVQKPQSSGNFFADIARELEQEEQQHEPF